MDNLETIAALAALAQPTRLDTFRLLVSREPDGVPAGQLARLMEVPQNTMSAHLAVLAHAGLVKGERQSRSIIYRANLARFREVALYLLKDCCGGRPDICAPIIADLTPCCPAAVVPSSAYQKLERFTRSAKVLRVERDQMISALAPERNEWRLSKVGAEFAIRSSAAELPLQIEDRGADAGRSRRISGSKRHLNLGIGF